MFVVLEIVTRAVLFPMSGDYVRFATYAKRADILVNQPGIGIALVGNSATEESVDPILLKSMLEQNVPGPVHVDLFLADGSEVSTWRAIISHYFWRRANKPDAIVITFFDNTLEDSDRVEWGRIAQFFTDVSDWPELFRVDLTSNASRIEFLVSSVWATYAARDRIKQRILTLAIPDFRRYDPILNDLNRRYANQSNRAVSAKQGTYRVLSRLLERARVEQVQVLLVAFPTRNSRYTIDPKIQKLAHLTDAEVLDMRQSVKLTSRHYRDNFHLNAEGRAIYSEQFGKAVSPLLHPTTQATKIGVTHPLRKPGT
ncbi:MAG: hypothetical protein ACREBU_11415 [Nitrososphaera sp.]